MNREDWLNEVAKHLEKICLPQLAEKTYRVSIGFPSTGRAGKRIGECWGTASSKDGVNEIFVHPGLDDAAEVVAILAHELCHVVAGCEAGHGPAFRRVATGIGLVGKMTATAAGDALKSRIADILQAVGPLPHAALNAAVQAGGKKKQSTRMIKVACPDCGYTVRVTRKWLDAAGAPICPACDEQMREE